MIMSITVQWLGHATFRIASENHVIYIDPWKLSGRPHDATLVLVSHGHYDHYSADDVAAVSSAGTTLVSTPDVISQASSGQPIAPGQTLDLAGVTVTAVPAYNPAKQFHPKSNNWVGFIVEIDGRRIYYAGDTDLTPEMQNLADIDLALLPIGGTYTMNAQEAAQAVSHFKPQKALPYHWGDIVGDRSDADAFAHSAPCEIVILSPGQSTTL
jgi:L-ascorbate metabolism protein UlaG (beta-lactamase superfamily)